MLFGKKKSKLMNSYWHGTDSSNNIILLFILLSALSLIDSMIFSEIVCLSRNQKKEFLWNGVNDAQLRMPFK